MKNIFRLIVIFFLATFVMMIFGTENLITKIFLKKFVFTPFNIVSMILFICYINNIWLGKIKSKIIYTILNVLFISPTCLSILNWLFPKFMNKVKSSVFVFLVLIFIMIVVIFIIVVIYKLIRRNKFKTDNNNNLNVINNRKKLINKYNGYNIKRNINIKNKNDEIRNGKNQVNVSQVKINNKPDFNKTEKCIAERLCPMCYSRLVARTNSYDGSYFLGCSSYGRTGCNFTINYTEYYRIKNLVKSNIF